MFRMTPKRYELLLSWVGPLIMKCSIRREPIEPAERLCITLRYLISGDAFCTTSMSDIFAGRKFRGFLKPRNFCIFAELNFAVRGFNQISREFIFAVVRKLEFTKLNFNTKKLSFAELIFAVWKKLNFAELIFAVD